jgi:pimeloyl-[acyl-carrier protein] methyl ester esterase
MINHVLEQAPPHANYLGWSLGGLIAIAIAIHFPKRVQKLMTMGSSPYFLEAPDWPGMPEHALQTFTQEIQQNHFLGLRRFLLTHLKDLNSLREIRRISNNMLQFTPQPQTLENGLELLKSTDLRKQLKNIQCPQLYCFGENDSLVLATVAKELEKLSPEATTHLFLNAGHVAFLSHNNEFSTTIRNFFQ